MLYDIDFRFKRALNPEGLTTLQTGIAAIEDAMRDARNAGEDPERDPAVRLLGRHLGRIARGEHHDSQCAKDQPLRCACIARVAALKSKPALVVLARRGVGYDREAQRTFVREASRQLRLVADHFGQRAIARIENQRNAHGAGVTLETPTLHVVINADRPTPGNEIAYRRNDRHTTNTAYADISAIVDADSFARKLAHELHLELTPVATLV